MLNLEDSLHQRLRLKDRIKEGPISLIGLMVVDPSI